MELVLVAVFLYLFVVALLFARRAGHAPARSGSIVAQSDRRNGAAWCLVPAGIFMAPLVMVVILVLLTIDAFAWIDAVMAALRKRRGKPPLKPNVDYGLGPDWVLDASPDDPYRASARPVLASLGSPRDGALVIARNMGRLLVAALATAPFLAVWVPIRRCQHECTGSTRTALGSARSAVDTDFSAKDAWGNPIELLCEDDEVVARTAGPDRKPGTEDDISVPPL